MGLNLTSIFKKLGKSKRGSWIDIFFVSVILFAFAVVITVGWLLMSNVNTEFQSKLSQTEATDIMQDNTDRYVNIFDGIFLFVFFGSFIAVLIGVLFLDTHPAFFLISLLLLIILCVVVAVMSNVYFELEQDDEMGIYTGDFTYIPFMMQHFVHIIIFMVCAISIALYGKSRMNL